MAYEKQSVWSCWRYANSGAGTIRGTCAGGGCKHNDGVPQESVKFTLTVKDSEENQIYIENLAEGTEIRADRLSEKESIKKEGSSVYFTDNKTGKSFDSAAISEDTVLSAVYVEEGTTEEVTLMLNLFTYNGSESEKSEVRSAKVKKGTRLAARDIMIKCGGYYNTYDYVLYDENGVQRNSVVVFKDMTVRIDGKRIPQASVTVEYSGGESENNTFSYNTGEKVTKAGVIWNIERIHSDYRVSSLKYKSDGTDFTDIENFTEDITLVATLVSSLSLTEVTVQAAQAAETIEKLAENKKVIVEGEITDEIRTQIFAAVKQCKNSVYLDFSKSTGLKSIPDSAFSMRDNLVGIAFPDSLETIGNYAFSQNSSLVEVKFGKGLKTIGELAFWQTLGSSYIGTFTIPASVEKIGAKAFDSYGEPIRNLSVAFENTSGWSAKKGDTVKTFTPEELSDPEKVKEYLCYNKYYSEYEWTRTPESTEEEPIE